jgi:nitrogenase molybdenum-iron protein alpha/beta subunit
VVITQLYGAGYDTILEKLTGVPNPQDFIAAVNSWFGVDALRDKLLQEYELTNREFIKSFYGRRVNTSQAKPYMLINRFIQSTAVDIALMGFDSIVRDVELKGLMDFIVPIFILHDALFLDVHKDYETVLIELSDVGSKNIPLFPGFQFPIKPEQLI